MGNSNSNSEQPIINEIPNSKNLVEGVNKVLQNEILDLSNSLQNMPIDSLDKKQKQMLDTIRDKYIVFLFGCSGYCRRRGGFFDALLTISESCPDRLMEIFTIETITDILKDINTLIDQAQELIPLCGDLIKDIEKNLAPTKRNAILMIVFGSAIIVASIVASIAIPFLAELPVALGIVGGILIGTAIPCIASIAKGGINFHSYLNTQKVHDDLITLKARVNEILGALNLHSRKITCLETLKKLNIINHDDIKAACISFDNLQKSIMAASQKI